MLEKDVTAEWSVVGSNVVSSVRWVLYAEEGVEDLCGVLCLCTEHSISKESWYFITYS